MKPLKIILSRHDLKTKTLPKPKSYRCDICISVFTGRQEFADHYKEDRINGQKCDKCNRIFNSICVLRKHFHTSHKKYHKCDICGKQFLQFSEFQYHMAYVHTVTVQDYEVHEDDQSDKVHEGQKEIIECHICGENFSDKYSHQRHIVMIHNVTMFRCVECHQEFIGRKELTKHKDSVHGGKNRENIMKHNLNSVVHEGQSETFNCNICDRIFSDEQTFQRHLSTVHTVTAKKYETVHEGNKNQKVGGITYQCNQCPYTTVHKDNFRRHTERVYEGQKGNFEWQFCGKILSDKSSLQRHLGTIHSEYYNCDICDNIFVDRNSLKVHVEQKHPETKSNSSKNDNDDDKENEVKQSKVSEKNGKCHKCGENAECHICGKVLSDKTCLKRHLKTCHNTDIENTSQCQNCGENTECQLCGKLLSDKSCLQRHLKVIHNIFTEKNIEYDMDDILQKQPDLENYHKSSQERPLQLECEKCDYSSSKFSELQKHIKEIHFKTEKVISDDSMMHYALCEICDYMSMDAADYQFHIKTAHEGETNKENVHGGSSFQSPNDLSEEATVSKRYNCDRCHYFTDRRSQIGKNLAF